jgi:D-glycero-alpha-D-manno-heptose-7-phosphate kinase
MVIIKTPFRISFFGGGTDYPQWYQKNAGAVLATTIDKYCYISCRSLPPFFKYKSRIVYSNIELINEISEIDHPSVRECMRYMKIQEGIEVHHNADLPARTGLGSSSAFTVGLLNALHALKGEMVPKKNLGLKAIHVEQNMIKENVGSQDQMLAAMGGLNHVRFSKSNTIDVSPMILKKDRLNEFQSHLLLIFTSFSRNASEIASEQIKNIPKKENELTSIYGMVQDAISILSGKSDILEFGKLLHESWMVKKSLSSRISTPMIDEIYGVARQSGVIGGKLLGAGAGGFMLLFAKPEDHKKIKKSLSGLLHVPFKFDTSGSQVAFFSG